MTKDPRTPEMAAAYDALLQKAKAAERHAQFWAAIATPVTAPARSADSVVQNLMRATRRRNKR